MASTDKEVEDAFDTYENEPGDWRDTQPRTELKRNTDVYNEMIKPATHNSFRLIKGVDPETGQIRTGYGYSGFDEMITQDLTTSNLIDDMKMGTHFVNLCNLELTDLQTIQELYGIDVTPTFRLVLQMRSSYTSTAKSVKGFLVNTLTTDRSESTVSRKFAPAQGKKKKSLFNLGGSKNTEENETMAYE